jgi:hypothetical protein
MNKQQTIQGLFSKKSEKKVEPTISDVSLTHSDPKVQAFYNSLTPQQIIAHTIAITHLGTSYDVTRTHGYTSWLKK